MKVLIAADIFPPAVGGPATYSVDLARELEADGVLSGVVSLTVNSDASRMKGRLVCVNQKNKILCYLQYLWLLYRSGRRADLIYAMGPVNAGLPSLLIAKFLHKKLAVKVVGDYAWEQGVVRFGIKDSVDDFQKNNGRYAWPVRFLKKIESMVVKTADQVIVPSKYLKGIAAGWGAPEAKIAVIYNAVEFPAVTPVAKPTGEKWIVTSGRLLPWKGAAALIKIMPEIIMAMPNVKLKIVGDGPVLDEMKNLALELNINGAVDFLGKLPRAEALSVKAAADLFVLNSGYEGLSHELLEAYEMRVSAIASRSGGNPEVVADEGRLFTYNDQEEIKNKILFYLSDSTSAVGDLKNAGEFTFTVMIQKTKQLLASICGN